MGRNRRNVKVEDDAAWVFNRMASVYDARPPYPAVVVNSIAEVALRAGSRLIDIGAGIGHLAFPLAERGFDVLAVEPARLMFERMKLEAKGRNVSLRFLHGAGEALAVGEATFDCALIADALHFLDVEMVAEQLRRVLMPHAVLVIVTCGFTPTPFMREVQKRVAQISDRRRRDVSQAVLRLASLSDVKLVDDRVFYDEVPLDTTSLERILRSVSFIGPAMAGARFDALRERLATIPHPPVWARTYNVRYGFRKTHSRFSKGR